MKTKVLTIGFLVIVFLLAGLNVKTDMKALKPVYQKYIQGKSIEKVETVNDAIDKIESVFNDEFALKYSFIEVNGLTKRTMGNWESNERIKLPGGYLVQSTEPVDMNAKAESMAGLKDYLEEQGIEFLYIALPNKVEPGKSELRPGIETSSNANVDALLKGIDKGGVTYYDLREDLASGYEAAGYGSWQSAFFKTDHHWLPQTAFWAYTDIAKRLQADYGFAVDERSMDINNYRIETYEDRFLGSSGRRTGICYGGLDDFSLIIPEFETDMSFEAPVEGIKRSGEYEKVFFEKKFLEKDYFEVDTFNTYTGGHDLCMQRNDGAVNDKKLLVVKDSYTLALQPYYSFMFREVDVIDLRYYEKETLKEYVDRTQPDMVIMEYSPGQMGEKKLFKYGLD